MSWLPRKTTSRSRSGSLSDYWGDRFGGFGDWFTSRKNDFGVGRYVRAVTSVGKVGNIVFQDEATFGFDLTGAQGVAKHVQLDAGILDDTSLRSWSDGQKVDALTGAALQEAARKRYNPLGKFNDIGGSGVANAARTLNVPIQEAGANLEAIHSSLEYLYATRQLADTFPGYEGYLAQDREYRHREDSYKAFAGNISDAVAKGNLALAAIPAICWNLLRPEDPIIPEGDLGRIVDAVSEEFRAKAAMLDDPDRLNDLTLEAITRLQELVKDPPPPQDDSGDGEGEGDAGDAGDEGESSEGSEGDSSAQESESKSPPRDGKATPEKRRMEELVGKVGLNSVGKKELESEEINKIHQMVESEWDQSDDDKGGVGAAGDFFGQRIPVVSVKAIPNKTRYQNVMSQVFGLVNRTRDSLRFRNERHAMDELGRKSGLVDENALHKPTWGEDAIFRRQNIQSAPQVHLALLVDESGSMDGLGESTARKVAALLQRSCAGFRGVNISIWGHTADENTNPNGATVFRYLEYGRGDVSSIGSIEARSGNCDGFAIAWCGDRMQQLSMPEDQKILIVLCDGQPASSDYYGPAANKHTRQVVDYLRQRQGIQVYALGMGAHLSESNLNLLYGANHWKLCQNPKDLPPAFSQILKKALRTGSI